jgi:hypothetical protein
MKMGRRSSFDLMTKQNVLKGRQGIDLIKRFGINLLTLFCNLDCLIALRLIFCIK